MRYADLVEAAGRVAATSKRGDKVGILADLLRRVPPDEVEIAVGLLLGRPRQRRLGVGWAWLTALRPHPGESSVTKPGAVPPGPPGESSVTKPGAGPLGPPGESSVTKPETSLTIRQAAGEGDAAETSLTIRDVDETFTRLAGLSGSGSQRARTELVRRLFDLATPAEAEHLRAVIIGEVRQGANEGVLTDAVAKAAGRPLAAVRRAAMLLGGIGPAAAAVGRDDDLAAIGLVPGTGVQPMLATTAASVTEALEALGLASIEAKLDGARVQIHRRGDDIRVFTRSLREIADSVPAVVAAVRAIDEDEFVIDGEALGLDEDGMPLAFQDTMQAETSLAPFFFDILSVGGESLIDRPLHERRQVLHTVLPPGLLLPSIETADTAAAERFAEDMIGRGHEGVMVKDLTSPYEAGRRGATWRKVKPVHTFDLVVLAAEWGSGRRTGWLSNLHLGARTIDGGFVMVGKTFKGLTDELLRWQTETFPKIALGSDGHVVHVRPELVVEIAIDGVQRSTRYPGGIALRFARVRRYRADKAAGQADTIDQLRAMLR